MGITEHTARGGPSARRHATRTPRLLAVRADLRELLDGGAADPAEVSRNLRDLARLNRLPGGANTSVAAIRALTPEGDAVSILDVGTGLADIPQAFARRGWRTIATDTHAQVLSEADAATANDPLVDVVEADCRHLPFPDRSFDVSHSSLLIHHLDPDAAVAAFTEMARVARRGVVVNDLRRGILPFMATGVAVALLGTCRATRADGLASVRRAYTVAELDALLAEAGLTVAWRSNAVMPRVVTAAVHARAP